MSTNKSEGHMSTRKTNEHIKESAAGIYIYIYIYFGNKIQPMRPQIKSTRSLNSA